jgi:hypothetical protein
MRLVNFIRNAKTNITSSFMINSNQQLHLGNQIIHRTHIVNFTSMKISLWMMISKYLLIYLMMQS